MRSLKAGTLMQPDLANGVLWYLVFLFSTVCHEAAHAWSAFRLGDDTAMRGGQMSLNPWPHIRRAPVGMVVVPVISWLSGGYLMGWASAPYNREWAKAFPRRAALMAMAGPAANLALALSAMLLMRLGLEWHFFARPFMTSANVITVASAVGPMEWVAHVLSVIFSLNLLLCCFNLLPVPPLDGSNIPLLVLPAKAADGYFSFLQSPVVRLVGLFLVLRGLGSVFAPILGAAADLLYFGANPN